MAFGALGGRAGGGRGLYAVKVFATPNLAKLAELTSRTVTLSLHYYRYVHIVYLSVCLSVCLFVCLSVCLCSVPLSLFMLCSCPCSCLTTTPCPKLLLTQQGEVSGERSESSSHKPIFSLHTCLFQAEHLPLPASDLSRQTQKRNQTQTVSLNFFRPILPWILKGVKTDSI